MVDFIFKIPRTRNRSNPQKNDQIWTKKHYPNQTNMRKTLPSFFFLSFSFVFISHHHLHKNKKIVKKLYL